MPYLVQFLTYAFLIVSQVTGQVTNQKSAVSFFDIPYTKFGNIGLLAHGDKAGIYFYELKEGDIITLTYTDRTERYVITDMRVVVDLYPDNQQMSAGKISWMDDNGYKMNTYELFDTTYGSNDLVLQTCRRGSLDRLFVLAERLMK